MSHLTIMYTSDVHGQLTASHYPTNKTVNQGLVRLASRRAAVQGPLLLLDGGDCLQGNVLLDYHRRFAPDQEHPVITATNALGYDAITLGNHDFNYGPTALNQFVKGVEAEVLCANLVDEHGQCVFTPYIIKTYDAFKVGIIGLVTGYVPNWEKPAHIEGWHFLDPVETAQIWIAQLRGRVDYLIVNYHGGFECDLKTGLPLGRPTKENQGCALACLAGIDLLLTGHQHVPTMHHLADKIVIQTGANAVNLAQITVTFTASGFHHQATLLDNDTPIDEALNQALEPLEKGTQAWLEAPLGTTDMDMLMNDPLTARKTKHPLFQWINDLQRSVSGADVSAASLPNEAPGFNKQIKLRDVAANFVYPNTLTVLKVTGNTLRAALERTAEYFTLKAGEIAIDDSFLIPKVEHYNYDVYDGIDYTFDVSQPKGQRVIKLDYNGQPLAGETELTLVLNNYRAQGGGDYPMFETAPIVAEIDVSLFDLAVKALQEKCHVSMTLKMNVSVKTTTNER